MAMAKQNLWIGLNSYLTPFLMKCFLVTVFTSLVLILYQLSVKTECCSSSLDA